MNDDEVTSGKRYNPLPYPRRLAVPNDVPGAAAECDIAVTEKCPLEQANMEAGCDRDSRPQRVAGPAITQRQEEE
jgi:hypothetical protein